MNRQNTPDRKLKVMIINILTGLEKRVGDITETLTETKRTNQVNNTINEIKNTLDGWGTWGAQSVK